jgi:hypothetical protein
VDHIVIAKMDYTVRRRAWMLLLLLLLRWL